MKKFEETPSNSRRRTSHGSSVDRRPSFISTKSNKSTADSEHKSGQKKSKHAKRPRGYSHSSLRSSAPSIVTTYSRKTLHADDSDASDTDQSLGETEEDVWFPGHNNENSGDINVEELDELLNFSDDDEYDDFKRRLPKQSLAPPDDLNSPENINHTRPFFVPHISLGESEDIHDDKLEHEDSGSVSGTGSGSSNSYSSGHIESLKMDDLGVSLPSSVPATPNIVPRQNGGHHMVKLTVADQQSQRFSFYAVNMETTIHAPDLASLVGETNSFSSLFKPENGVWFLDCYRPTDKEMRALTRAFGIHPLTAEDISTQESREKFEMFKNYYFVAYHTFEDNKEDENYTEQIKMYFLVFNEGVISFHFEPVSHCRNVRRRMRQLKDYLTLTSDWIAYALIDDITDIFAPEIRDIEQEADFVEDAVYLDNQSVEIEILLTKLGEARKRTMKLMRMLSGKADVIRGFAKRCTETNNMPGSEMALYLGDVQDHVLTMYQNLSAYEKIFSKSHFNYMGLLQMEFVNSSNRMTDVLGRVTIIGTVLVPLNLITGLFGMNVKVPGEAGSNLGWFFGILGVMILIICVLLTGSMLYLKFHVYKKKTNRAT